MESGKVGQGRASGKVILFGEHAVVHGVSAIAAGIDRGAVARCERAASDAILINGQVVEPDSQIFPALQEVRIQLGVGPARLDLELELPPGAGLGASAALGVATVRALGDLNQLALDERRVFLAAQAWERVFHGNPSGVDVAAAQSGRPIRFSRTSDPDPLLMQRSMRLLVAQAGPPASTKEMVAGVARLKERNPSQFTRTLDAIAALVENATLLLKSGDLVSVGKLMDLNQMLLAGWMLSTQELEDACRRAREEGALGAKLTGSGGGGCVIALAGETGHPEAEERARAILASWRNAEFPCFSTEIHGALQPT